MPRRPLSPVRYINYDEKKEDVFNAVLLPGPSDANRFHFVNGMREGLYTGFFCPVDQRTGGYKNIPSRFVGGLCLCPLFGNNIVCLVKRYKDGRRFV